ncbi:MAG: IclR family transcriptional regulator [Firmicutes bacterium]|nr:IclR family transcriptional regulator [Bacillota bacterium]
MSRSRKEGEGETVQAVKRALLLLEILAKEAKAMSISELSKKSNLKLTTVHRLLNTMMSREFIEQDETTLQYRLGIKAFEVGNAALATNDLRMSAQPSLKQLAQQVNETTNLAVLDGSEVVYIDQLESTNIVIVKMFARVGNRGPAYCTGTGKVLLADLTPEEIRERFRNTQFIKFTPRTITNIEELLIALAKIREDGYALDFSERDEGVTCVAAPIRNYENRVCAAISVSGPAGRMTEERIRQEILPAVIQAANEISKRLGFKKQNFAK